MYIDDICHVHVCINMYTCHSTHVHVCTCIQDKVLPQLTERPDKVPRT